MVLESIIAGLLNKYLGKYVQNLDSENLNLGIFSGSLELTDLELKPEALYELNLPIEVKAGHIGRIIADIQWTSLFSKPLSVSVEDVLILAGPVYDRPYDEARERQLQNAVKRKLLEDLDRAKKTQKVKSKEEEAEDLSFTERLTINIVNNIQFHVRNVHVRYEDSATRPGEPFAFGFTLRRLYAETADEAWHATTVDASATVVRKLAEMNELAVYWNPDCLQLMGQHLTSNAWREMMRNAVNSHSINGENLALVVEPMTTAARLAFDKTTAPEYLTPMLAVDILTEMVVMTLSHQQYLNILDLIEGMKLMEVNQRYRKYRPAVRSAGHAKEWWKYAYNCIVEEHIRPWSSKRLEKHNQLYRQYMDKYREKLTVLENKEDPATVNKELVLLEETLDVTSIMIAREKVKIQFAKGAPERERIRREKKKAEKSWLWSWLGWDSDSEDETEEDTDEDDIWSQLTEGEQERIKKEIGYDAKAMELASDLPPEYVQNKFNFQLSTCNVVLKNSGITILQSSLHNVQAGFMHRPGSQGFQLLMSTDSVLVEGCSPSSDQLVPIVTSEKARSDTISQIFSLDFETNPQRIVADTALAVTTEPVDITYHEHTVSELISFLTVPNLDVEALKSVAATQLQELAKAGKEGLLHAVENHKTIQIDIDMKSPNILIPEFGSLDKGGHLLVVDLGSLRVNSDLQSRLEGNMNAALGDATPTEIEARLYDKFVVRLDDIQVLLIHSSDDWHEAITLKESDYHLIPSMGLQLNVFNSVKPDYKALPQQKIEAVLPSLKLKVSDKKLNTLLKFAHNLPLPSSKVTEKGPPRGVILKMDPRYIKRETTFFVLRKIRRAARRRGIGAAARIKRDEADSGHSDDDFYSASDHSDTTLQQWAAESPVPSFDDNDSHSNRTSILIRFAIREMVLSVSRNHTSPPTSIPPTASSHDTVGTSDTEYLSLRIDSMCIDVAISTYGLAVQLGLKGVRVIDKFHMGHDGMYLHLLSSASKSDLVSVLYRKVNPTCPDFVAYYNAMEQAVMAKVTALNVVFHRTAALMLKEFLQELMDSFMTSGLGEPSTTTQLDGTTTDSVPSQPTDPRASQEFPDQPEPQTTSPSDEAPKPPEPRGTTKFFALAKLDYLCISFCDVSDLLANVFVRDLEVSANDRASRTTLRARLRDFSIEDPVDNSLYSKILCLQDQTAFDVKFGIFKKLPGTRRKALPKAISSFSESDGVASSPTGPSTRPVPPPDPVHVDYSLRFRGGRIQAVLMGQFIRNVTTFFQPFIKQVEIIQASESSRVAVQKKMKDLSDEGLKISWYVNIRAPVIFIPQSPQSTRCLVAHLGDLMLSNNFEEVEVEGLESKSLIDHMSLQLNSIELSRGLVQPNQVLGIHRLLIEPLTLRVHLKWAVPPVHESITPLDISIILEHIEVNVGEQDVVSILAVINDNLLHSEGTQSMEAPTITVEVHSSDPAGSKMLLDEPVTPTPGRSTTVVDAAKKKAVHAEFVLQGVHITLFTNEPRLPMGGQGLDQRDLRYGLSSFQLQEVKGSASVFTGGSIEVQATMLSVTLDDIRPKSPLAIKSILLKSGKKGGKAKPRAGNGDSPMISLTYSRNELNDQQVEFTVDGIRVNIFVHYLLAVSHFFSSAVAKPTVMSPTSSFPGSTSRQTSRMVVEPAPVELRQGTLRVTGHIRKPEVVLFDDPTSENSQVLVMKLGASLAFQADIAEETAVANITDVEIYSCVYSQPLQTAYKVLEPCALTFTRSVSATRDETMAIDVTEVKFHISPRVVYLVQGVIEALNSVRQKPTATRHLIDYDQEDMWTPKPIFSHGFHKRKGSMKNMVDFGPTPDLSGAKQRLTMQVPRVKILLELEEDHEHVAMLGIRSGLKATVCDWSHSLNVSAEVSLEVHVYNEKVSTWEPLVEPVMEQEKVYRPWELIIKMSQAEGHPIVCTSLYDSNPCSQRDSMDGVLPMIKPPGSYPATESDTESDSQDEAELEWDGHYSSSFLSSDIGSPMEAERQFQPETKSEEDLDESDSEGFFDKAKDFFSDIFFSDSDEEKDEAEGEDGTALQRAASLEGGKTDSGIASLAQPTSASVTSDSSTSKDEVDSDLTSSEPESQATYLVINSWDRMELSVTPFTISVLIDLTNAFTARPEPKMRLMAQHKTALSIINTTGLQAKMLIPVELMSSTSAENVTLEPVGIDQPDQPSLSIQAMEESEDPLECLCKVVKPSRYSDVYGACPEVADCADGPPTPKLKDPETGQFIFEVAGMAPITHFAASKVTQTPFILAPLQGGEEYPVVREVDVSHGKKTIKVRSPLQVVNNCPVTMQLYYKALELQTLQGPAIPGQGLDEYTLLARVKPKEVFDVPVIVAYNAGIYACPADQGYNISEKPIKWQELMSPTELTIRCKSRQKGELPFHFKVTRKEHKLTKSINSTADLPSYVLDLFPPITIHNYLPYDVVYSMKENGLKFLLKGDKMAIYSTDLSEAQKMKIQVKSYLAANWEGNLLVSREMKSHESITMETKDVEGDQKKYLTLWAHSTTDEGTWDIFLYTPYWIVNKSELPIEIRASRSRKVFNNHSLSEPILFSFSNSRRRKAKLRVFDSVWSASFSLDTVGSSGVVICKDEDHDRTYQFWLEISLSKLTLTKIVTLTPYFLIRNKTDHVLSYMEEGVRAGIWVNIKPTEVLPFWPGSESMKLICKRAETPDQLCSRHFSIDSSHSTALRMERGTALTVETEGGVRGPTTVTFKPYSIGHAPVRVDNLCDDVNLRFNQKNIGGRLLVQPHKTVLLTWDDPTAERMFLWNLYNRNKKSFNCVIDRDGWGKVTVSVDSIKRSMMPGDGLYVEGDDIEMTPASAALYEEDAVDSLMEHPLMHRKEKTTIFWVSYMDGLQRVLMFTQSPRIARAASQANISELASLELFISLEGLGLSLINSKYEEVAYVSLYCPPARWEVETRPDKWKSLNIELSSILEDKYRIGAESVAIEEAVEADLINRTISKPVEGRLRRLFYPAVWMHFRKSDHHTGLHVKVQKVQIDNQLFDAYFTTVLNVLPIPKDILRKTGPRPFIEMSLLRRQVPENDVDTVKYFKVLIQEASVKIDNGFLLSVVDIVSGLQEEEDEVVSLKADLSYIQRSLRESSSVVADGKLPIYFEYFHLSPLKIIVSLSLSGEPHVVARPTSFKRDLVRFFVESVGSTLSEVTEVELKLAFFERTNILLTPDQLLEDVKGHYISQGIKQAYVFILGLDVLGNPYGLFRGVKEGISDFFYEPYLGAIQGPGEFAEGLAKGVQSLLGHTVGGVADTLSGLSGTLGRALAVLSFDDDYQRRRLQRMQRHPDSLPKTFLYAGQGFVMGFVMGLSGVFTSPIKGAHDGGLKGFFKGIGKGLLGLLSKPAGSLVDGVTVILDGIERATELGENIVIRMRIPRFINPSVGLEPYSLYEAKGNSILHKIRRSDLYQTDVYFFHAVVTSDSTPDVVLLTDKRILVLERCRWWGGWDLEQCDLFNSLIGDPTLGPNKIIYKVQPEGSDIVNREIRCDDEETAQWVLTKLQVALNQTSLDSPVVDAFLTDVDH
ncbi:vacuolar protein sorting-associated protein 13A-like [Acanthaster planci]|uniref:Vacuolar protein sorting-associated protein 13A-like n=1 Tax=Acanthaster planci TaxID=133434 RepID=A0A8B7Z4Y2_ACAPL|nr:vacuolar protein sorting-associated protein 13A-like [Acanthaster planci]